MAFTPEKLAANSKLYIRASMTATVCALLLADIWLLRTSQAAIGSQLMSVAGVFSHLPHSIDTLTALSTVRSTVHVLHQCQQITCKRRTKA